MAAIDELIGELQADGSVDSEGRFTLDREQARSKMQRFQLVDARRYVLELVQAAVLRGAEAIAFEIDADDMRMRFDGKPFTRAEIDDLYGSLFAEGDSRELRGVRQLALALNAAGGMDPKFIDLRSGDVELEIRPGKPDAITVHDQAVAGTQLHVRQRVRPRLLLDFLLNLTGRLAEEQYLRQRCIYSRVPITLDGHSVSADLSLQGEAATWIAYHGKDFHGAIGIRAASDGGRAELRLLKDGVWIDSRELAGCGDRIVAVVDGDSLRKDVSQAKIVSGAALDRIVAATLAVRWRLWQRFAEGKPDSRTLIRDALLDHASAAELRDNADARALAETVTWLECRGEERTISLAELVDRAARGETGVRWALRSYPELAAGGDPILLIYIERDVPRLERLLGHDLVDAEGLLARELRRELGRKAWLEREGEPELPAHVSMLFEAAIEAEGISGRIGIDGHTLAATELDHPIRAMLYKQRRLLGRIELDVDIPNLWLAIDAAFEPTDDYRDAVRDKTFADVLLRALACARGPLERLLEMVTDMPTEPLVRGLVKRWLIPFCDQKAQIRLLARAGVDVAPGFYRSLAKLLPELSRKRLGGDELVPLATHPLFAQLDGSLASLADIASQLRNRGKLRCLDKAPGDERLSAPEVLILGPGDRKIVRGLFGADSCESFELEPLIRERRHLDQPQIDLARIERELTHELQRIGARPDAHLVELDPSDGGVAGFVLPDYAALEQLDDDDDVDPDDLDTVRLVLHRDRRPLVEVECELGHGLGPLRAIVDCDALETDELYEELIDNAGIERVLDRVRVAADELCDRIARGFDSESAAIRRRDARMLLHAAATAARRRYPQVAARREALEHLPLFEAVSGATLSLAQVRSQVATNAQLELVDPDTAWTSLDGPEIVKLDSVGREDLRILLGVKLEVFVDGTNRVRHRQVYAKLESRPRIGEARLRDGQVFAAHEIQGEGRRGEYGISRERDTPELHLRLGIAGFLVDELHEAQGFWIAVDAVAIDDEIPVDDDGNPVRDSKRYRQLVRQLRRGVPRLVTALCEDLDELPEHARRPIWDKLVGYLEHEVREDRGKSREQAYEVASAVPGFVDLWGQRHSLASIVGRGGGRPVSVLTRARADVPDRLRGRLILRASPAEIACLEAHTDVTVLDDEWDELVASLEHLAEAPSVERPDIDAVALAYRKAQVAGGLECEIWIPRDYSPLEPKGPPPALVWVVDGRELGRVSPVGSTPCAGLIRTRELAIPGELELDDRQRNSLVRQILIIYIELAEKLRDGQVAGADHARALEYMAWVDLCFMSEVGDLDGVGQRVESLRALVAKLVPPMLRERLWRETVEPDAHPDDGPAAQPKPEPEPEPEPKLEPDPKLEPKPKPASKPSEPEPARAPVVGPEERLLSAIWNQLEWARDRHGDVLDELRLAHLELVPTGTSTIAELRVNGIAVNAGHPLIARLLGQDPHDPFDLAFVVAAIYTLMNDIAEQITDDHERMFVGQLAETLALALRASSS